MGKIVQAQVEVDKDNGPLVRVTHSGVTVAVYLHDETAVVTTRDGQYGLEVTGPWHELVTTLTMLKERDK